MSVKRLLAIAAIVFCTAVAWLILGGAVMLRSQTSASQLEPAVVKNWGPPLTQEHPVIYYEAPVRGLPPRAMQPLSSKIDVHLTYDPKRKGLLWYRTYVVDFRAEYRIKNPTPIAQTIYVAFTFPSADARYDAFTLAIGDNLTNKVPVNGVIRESVRLEAGEEAPLFIAYRASGMNQWSYDLGHALRVKDLQLALTTNFTDIDIPAGAESPTSRVREGSGWTLAWQYTDVLGANSIAMAMPSVHNPGEIARRMTLFAPVSLLFFFSVLVIVAMRNRTDLHPMNYFFLAAGCFAFQLLFAYLVDLMPLGLSFLIAAAVSLLLVNGYLWRAAGSRFAAISTVAQFAYMVLFSYSFFFDGLTGITITVGAIATLALLMAFTAKVNWNTALISQVQKARTA